jgi:hyaluronan synthase
VAADRQLAHVLVAHDLPLPLLPHLMEATSRQPSFSDLEEPQGRQLPSIRLLPCVFKLALSFSLVTSLIVGYALSFKVVKFGSVSLGLYGVILLVDFLVQFGCALLNRRSVNQIAAKAAPPGGGIADEKARGATEGPVADISIAVVGYREDEVAWRKCLRSLQQQTLRPRALIAVVDGNDAPDMIMADAFESEFEGQDAIVVHLPVLLSSIYRETYFDVLANSGEVAPGLFTTFWRWLRNTSTAGQIEALKAARARVIHEVLSWKRAYELDSHSAVCFTQPHGHKRVIGSYMRLGWLDSVTFIISDCDVHRVRGGYVWLWHPGRHLHHRLGYTPG